MGGGQVCQLGNHISLQVPRNSCGTKQIVEELHVRYPNLFELKQTVANAEVTDHFCQRGLVQLVWGHMGLGTHMIRLSVTLTCFAYV